MWANRKSLLALTLAVAAAVPGCGDDNNAGSDTVTHDEWFAAVCEKIGDVDPGFDAFFAEHPDPTLDEWAAFLPTVITSMDRMIDGLDSTPAPDDERSKVDAAVEAITAVRDSFATALTAAEAGDDDAFAAAEAENQSTLVPAMEAAMSGDEECPTEQS